MFQWFNAREAKAFGNALADQVIAELGSSTKADKKRPEDKKDRIVRQINAKVAEFKQRERLNVYKIAQLGNTFRWRLKEAGVDANYIETLTTLLITRAR